MKSTIEDIVATPQKFSVPFDTYTLDKVNPYLHQLPYSCPDLRSECSIWGFVSHNLKEYVIVGMDCDPQFTGCGTRMITELGKKFRGTFENIWVMGAEPESDWFWDKPSVRDVVKIM